jgi:poly(A) polymerase
MLVPEEQRRFAVEVVRRLRGAKFDAYWAGGCVRDQLLGRTPKDYDVATSARPEQVRELFGRGRTLAIGAAFGVISVMGPKVAGAVEVTTFRRDAAYSDGRHPDGVTFSSAEEDAARRDFTINGLFYDPIQRRVIDFVGGQDDLAAKQIRAIGSARDRFAEDKLRMLRAVRFAAAFGFTLDTETWAAIGEMTPEIHVVSPERIAMEMRRVLSDSSRAAGVRLLWETGLAAEVLPEVVPRDNSQLQRFDDSLELLSRLGGQCGFPLALGALLSQWVDAAGAAAVGQRWRLSNKETDRTCWLVKNHDALQGVQTMRWSALQPLLTAEGIADLLALAKAVSPAGAAAAAYCRQLLAQPPELLDPRPLVTGDDLQAIGIPPGPDYQFLLQRIRDAQLDGDVRSKTQALAKVSQWRGERGERREEREEGGGESG